MKLRSHAYARHEIVATRVVSSVKRGDGRERERSWKEGRQRRARARPLAAATSRNYEVVAAVRAGAARSLAVAPLLRGSVDK